MEKAKEFQENIYFCFIDYFKAFDCMDLQKPVENSQRIEDHTTSPISWETCTWVKKQQLETDLEKPTGSKLGKECDKTLYCHPAYLTYMQSISGWMTHKLGSRLPEEILTSSDIQMKLL